MPHGQADIRLRGPIASEPAPSVRAQAGEGSVEEGNGMKRKALAIVVAAMMTGAALAGCSSTSSAPAEFGSGL